MFLESDNKLQFHQAPAIEHKNKYYFYSCNWNKSLELYLITLTQILRKRIVKHAI